MRVMVIYSNQEYMGNRVPFPPVGTLGDVISGPDEDNEFDIMFDHYPCDTLDENDLPSWVTHCNMVMPIDLDLHEQKDWAEAAA